MKRCTSCREEWTANKSRLCDDCAQDEALSKLEMDRVVAMPIEQVNAELRAAGITSKDVDRMVARVERKVRKAKRGSGT